MFRNLVGAIRSAIGAVDAPVPSPTSGSASVWLADALRKRQAESKAVSVFTLTLDQFDGKNPSTVVRKAGAEDIRKAFALLAAGKKDFLILTRTVVVEIGGRDDEDEDDDDFGEESDEEFIQVVRNEDGSYGLEVNVKSGVQAAVLLTSEIVLPVDATLDVLLDYRREDSRWVNACAWRFGTA